MGAIDQESHKALTEVDALRARVAELEHAQVDLLRAGRRTSLQYEVTRVLADAATPDDAMLGVLRIVCAKMDWVWGAAWMVDEPDQALRFNQCWRHRSVDVSSFTEVSRACAFTAGEGLPGRVWERQTPTWVADITADAGFPRALAAKEAGLHAAFGFPWTIGGAVMGVMEFFSGEIREPDEELLAIVGSIGSQIGQFLERIHAEMELRGSESRMRAMLESSLDAIVSMDHHGAITEFNPAAEKMFGYRREEAMGQDLGSLIVPPRLRDQHRDGLKRYLETGQSDILGQRIELVALRSDGTEFPVELAINPVYGDHAPGFTGYIRDITGRRQAEQRERFLALATEILTQSIDFEETLTQLAGVVVPAFADWCIVGAIESDGTFRRLAASHADEEREALLREMIGRYPPEPDGAHPLLEVIHTRRSHLNPHMKPSVLREIARDEDHLAVLKVLDPRSILIVPLVIHDRVVGVIEFLRSQPGWRFGREDQALGEELARRAAVAVDNAQLHHATEQALRAHEASLALLETIFISAPVGLAFWDCDLRFVRINQFLAAINGAPVERHLGHTLREVVPKIASSVEPVLRSVIASGIPVLDVETIGETPAAPGQIRHFLASYYPVKAQNGQVLGVGGVVSEITERRQAEDNLRFLAEASRVMSGTLDYERTLSTVTELAVPSLADWCIIYLLDEDGAIRRLAMAYANQAHESIARIIQEEFPLNPDAGRGVPAVIRTGRPVLYEDVAPGLLASDVSAPERLRKLVDSLGVRSWMCVPMTLQGRTFGAISFMTAESGRRYDQSILKFAEDIGRRAAVAIDNALLYRQAQDAIKVREQFLSIASHELKTPLTSIKASSQLLSRSFRTQAVDPERTKRLAGLLEGEVVRLERLVADLLDATRIRQGRLELSMERVDLVELVREVLDRFEHAPTRQPGHVLTLDADDAVLAFVDPARIDQVVTNLISNALKYSPGGGYVRTRVISSDTEIMVAVSDEGIGISLEEREKLFQPFSRGDHTRQSIGGTGLGLFISHQIVERHGGTILVESNPGKGATFTMRIPRVEP